MGNRNILKLLLSFLKIGLFTFGGGYAMIPLIQREMVEKHQWITSDELLEMVAISESTPGPIAVNIATFVGYRVGGVLGSFCATVGVILPAFFIIVVISLAIKKFENLKMVRYGFMGIRAGALCATVGVALPSFLIIIFVAKCYEKFKTSTVVKGCMTGLKPGVIGLIAAAVVSVATTVFFPDGIKKAVLQTPEIYISAAVFLIMCFLAFKKKHPILIICLSAVIGIAAGNFFGL